MSMERNCYTCKKYAKLIGSKRSGIEEILLRGNLDVEPYIIYRAEICEIRQRMPDVVLGPDGEAPCEQYCKGMTYGRLQPFLKKFQEVYA
jgi:hypothetical protein